MARLGIYWRTRCQAEFVLLFLFFCWERSGIALETPPYRSTVSRSIVLACFKILDTQPRHANFCLSNVFTNFLCNRASFIRITWGNPEGEHSFHWLPYYAQNFFKLEKLFWIFCCLSYAFFSNRHSRATLFFCVVGSSCEWHAVWDFHSHVVLITKRTMLSRISLGIQVMCFILLLRFICSSVVHQLGTLNVFICVYGKKYFSPWANV